MTWRKDAPDNDDPVLLLLDGDAGMAVKRGDEFVLFDPENPADVRLVQPAEVKGWMPYPKTPEEAERMRSEAEAWAEQPQRALAAAYQQMAGFFQAQLAFTG